MTPNAPTNGAPGQLVELLAQFGADGYVRLVRLRQRVRLERTRGFTAAEARRLVFLRWRLDIRNDGRRDHEEE